MSKQINLPKISSILQKKENGPKRDIWSVEGSIGVVRGPVHRWSTDLVRRGVRGPRNLRLLLASWTLAFEKLVSF